MKKVTCFLVLFLITAPAFSGEAAKGEKVFKRCKACHLLVSDGPKKVGPHLQDILGRLVGSVEGYKYSKALQKAAEEGTLWDVETLDAFLAAPRKFYKGTKMSFSGLKNETQRADLIAFLKSTSPASATENSDPEVSPEILAIEGDVEYGEYLASACVTCHQANGTDQGIPSITGWPTEAFVTVMHAYKNKHRENQVMQQQAGRLANDEIAAIAAYFANLK